VSATRATDRTKGWPAVDDAKLRELWDAGMGSREIGKQLRCSRDAVLGRARRLGLARRQPLRREA
jgi:hypothetical protein